VVVVLKNPKDIFLSHSLSLPKKHERKERVLKEENALCVRVCVVVTRKEREREECALHRAMMMMQNSSFFLLGWLLSARREGEKKNSSETLNPNFQKSASCSRCIFLT